LLICPSYKGDKHMRYSDRIGNAFMVFRGTLIIAAWIWVAPTHAQQQTADSIAAYDYRPLAAALDNLQRSFGGVINYEDVPYANPADLEDSATPEQKKLDPTFKFLVPRRGQLTASIPANGISSEGDRISIINGLLSSYRANELPGDFRVEYVGDAVYVVPTRVLSAAGTMTDVQSVMATPVTIPFAQVSAIEAVKILLDAVSKASGADVKVGAVPFRQSTKASISADREPARNVLARLLASLNANTASYRLLYDPVVKYYMLNLQFVSPAASSGMSSTPAPVPALVPAEQTTSNPFYAPSK
jgi:hypothetical protein